MRIHHASPSHVRPAASAASEPPSPTGGTRWRDYLEDLGESALPLYRNASHVMGWAFRQGLVADDSPWAEAGAVAGGAVVSTGAGVATVVGSGIAGAALGASLGFNPALAGILATAAGFAEEMLVGAGTITGLATGATLGSQLGRLVHAVFSGHGPEQTAAGVQ